ncbi:MAG TPA: hypothetical protein VIA62_09355 [Thermoanaerobaculia bacterium]|jgi:hypothetical protein|nr:hypothetical protein [Thermoanaerobaculia bacterium]
MSHSARFLSRLALALLLVLLAAGAPAARAALPAGTVVELGSIQCPTTSPGGGDPTPPVPAGGRLTCGRIQITNCPGAPDLDATVWIVTLAPGTTLKGTIFLHSGGGGTGNFTSAGASHKTLETNYENAGYQLLDIAWDSDWEQTDTPSILGGACRPAAVARWAFASSHIHNGRRDIGFCGQGHSGGSAVMSYLMAEYGLEDTFDYVMLSAGPVFARVDCGCDTALSTCTLTSLCPELPLATMRAALGYASGGQQAWLDSLTGTSTCGQNTGSNPGDPIWRADSSVTASGADLAYPKTGMSAWYCVDPATLNTSSPEGSYYVHLVSQLLPGQRPDVFCTKTGCTGEGVYNGTIGGVPVTTLMAQQMAAGCIPRHAP